MERKEKIIKFDPNSEEGITGDKELDDMIIEEIEKEIIKEYETVDKPFLEECEKNPPHHFSKEHEKKMKKILKGKIK